MTDLITSCFNDAVRAAPNGAATQLVVPANPKRLYLQVWSLAGNSVCGLLLPDPAVLALIVNAKMPSGSSWKFADCPTLTSGEWYGKGTDADGWVWVEEVYNGE